MESIERCHSKDLQLDYCRWAASLPPVDSKTAGSRRVTNESGTLNINITDAWMARIGCGLPRSVCEIYG